MIPKVHACSGSLVITAQRAYRDNAGAWGEPSCRCRAGGRPEAARRAGLEESRGSHNDEEPAALVSSHRVVAAMPGTGAGQLAGSGTMRPPRQRTVVTRWPIWRQAESKAKSPSSVELAQLAMSSVAMPTR